MKKKLLTISLIFLIVCIISGWERLYGQSVWKTYVKLLNKMYPGLTPYKMPTPADGPGTIFFIDKMGVEQLYFDQKKAFPELELQQPVNVPSAYLSEMSSMQFRVGISAGGQKILTNEVNLAAGLAITKDTYVTVSVANPMIHRAQNGLINLKITEFDIRNSIHEDILKKLQESNTIIISGSLHVDSFVYTFHRGSTIDSALDASLENKSAGFNITYKKITDTEFSLEARSPMFWAYYAYPIDRGKMEQLYNDKLKIKELEDAEQKRANYESTVQKFEQEQNQLSSIKAESDKKTEEKNDLENQLKKLENQIITTMEATLVEDLKKQKDALETKINSKINEINELRNKIGTFEQHINSLGEYRGQLKSLNATQDQNIKEIELLKKKKYNLFGKEVIIPSEIRE